LWQWRAGGVELPLERFDEPGAQDAAAREYAPVGKILMEDFYYAGGLRALLRQLGDKLTPVPRVQRQDARRQHRARRDL